jgi:hypothetical protein
MGPRIHQLLTTLAVLFGLTSSAMLLSAFGGDVVGIFTSRDRRFVLLLLTAAAVASAVASRLAALALGTIALIVMLTQSYPGLQLDIAALRVASALLLAFNVCLGAQIWADRADY